MELYFAIPPVKSKVHYSRIHNPPSPSPSTSTQSPDNNVTSSAESIAAPSYSQNNPSAYRLRARAFTDLNLHASNSDSSTSSHGPRKPLKTRHSYTHHHTPRNTSIGLHDTDIAHKRGKLHSDRMSNAISHSFAPLFPRSRYSKTSNTSNGADLNASQSAHLLSTSSLPTSRKHPLLASSKNNVLTKTNTDSTSGQSSSNISSNDASKEALHSDDKNPFVTKHARRYLSDPNNPYPLPLDLPEWHRQTLRTMLLTQLIGSPILSPSFDINPPGDVLEIGCGTGFWSSLCHQHFARLGHSVSFTGIDIVNTAPNLGKDGSMKWKFVQCNVLTDTYPFPDNSFDLVMSRDMSLVFPQTGEGPMEEYFRILRPGGTLEIWENDHLLRTLADPNQPQSDGHFTEIGIETPEDAQTRITGTYKISNSTTFATAQNEYLADYNAWMTTAMQARRLTVMPCTDVSYVLMSEGQQIKDKGHLRLAIPLGEIRWEREGVGVAIEDAENSSRSVHQGIKRILTPLQTAIRQTALSTFLQSIDSLAPILRAASGKNQDEWDKWVAEMTDSLVNHNGAAWGECLEFGAWWAVKKDAESKPKVVKKPSLTIKARTGDGGSEHAESPTTAAS